MAIVKLTKKVQSLLSSSVRFHTFKRVVEELVYNALDAQSTSIAIRINFQEKNIQVIDNGKGISRCDLKLVGQRYVTSKLLDENTLKSVPNVFGYQGQSLASIIEVSNNVKITTRHEATDETWLKAFCKGKEIDLDRRSVRPSKGTTVEVSGFLYNLSIQEKLLNYLTELQEIKSFVEHLSFTHSNVSISLRDDSKNEIVFKVHKNQDIYQTFLSLFDIKREEITELKVEKNHYYIKAYIGKTEKSQSHHWIFLNNRFLPYCKLHTKVKEYMSKHLQLQNKIKDKSKFKTYSDPDEASYKSIPFYYIFIGCPYYDYDINYNGKVAHVVFKNWDQINKLLAKLVSFFAGNSNDLKRIPEMKPLLNHEETREQVQRIVDKILGSNSKAIDVSKMHKGIKGKMVKRKVKDNVKKEKVRILPLANNMKLKKNKQVPILKANTKDKTTNIEVIHEFQPPLSHKQDNKTEEVKKTKQKSNKKLKETKNSALKQKQIIFKGKIKNKHFKTKTKKDPVIQKFENGSESVRQRCQVLAKRAKNMINKYKQAKNIVGFRETEQNKKTVSVRKRVNEVVIHNYLPLKDKDVYSQATSKELCYDLTHIERFHHLRKKHQSYPQKDSVHYFDNYKNSKLVMRDRNNLETADVVATPQLTYESHRNYDPYKIEQRKILTRNTERQNFARFISKESREVFDIKKVNNLKKTRVHTRKLQHPYYQQRNIYSIFEKAEDSCSYSIQCFESNVATHQDDSDPHKVTHRTGIENINRTQTIPQLKDIIHSPNKEHSKIDCTYTVSNCLDSYNSDQDQIMNFEYRTCEEAIDDFEFTFISKSQEKFGLNNIEHDQRQEVKNHEIEEQMQENKNNEERPFTTGADKLLISTNPDFQLVYQSSQRNNGSDKCPEFLQMQSDTLSNSQPTSICILENTGRAKSPILHSGSSKLVTTEIDIKRPSMSKSRSLVAMSNNKNTKEAQDFLFKERFRFLPKGMSQIFANCNSKTACDYNIDKDYFQNSLYKNFIKKVEINAEVFKPVMRNINEHTTRDIERVNKRLIKDNAALVFNATSLKEAKILGQVDDKFIASTLTGKLKHTNECSKVLVLFDQHAVHERIRLEDNLSGYLANNQWKSIPLESNFSLILSKDSITYLHNYKNKFEQFGLNWTILDDTKVEINAIPEALLGKNNRTPETIMKAVKNLIIEETTAIRAQKGCTSLYPKSIMDLVFSEACRYVIKFGDSLPKSVCSELIQKLSFCNTPFQCAHGRPVMAVIMDLKETQSIYKVNMEKVIQFQRNVMNRQLNMQ